MEEKVPVQISDVNRQQSRPARLPAGATVEATIRGLVSRLNLPVNDPAGRPLTYRALNERTGEQMPGHLTVGEVLQPGDEVTLLPEPVAG